MAKIKHSDLFDFPAYEQAIKDVKASTVDFGKSVQEVIERIGKSQAELTAEFAKFQATLKNLNVASPGAGSNISGISAQINQVTVASEELAATQRSLYEVMVIQNSSVKENLAIHKQLKAQLAALKPSQADYAQQVGIIKGRLDLVLPSIKAFNTAVKGSKQTIDAAQGSYKGMSQELSLLKAQLNALPNAFNPVTGNLNKANKEAVALQGKIAGLSGALKVADADMGTFSRNVGNYSNAFSKGFGALRQIAYILPGIGIAGIFNVLFEGIQKVVEELGLFDTKLTNAQKAQNTLNTAMKSSEYLKAAENVKELAINIDLAKNGFISKKGVLKEYNETIGKTTGQVSSLDEAEKELVKNGPAYVQMILYKAAAQIASADAAKKMVDAAIEQQEREKKIAKNFTERQALAAKGDKEGSGLAQFEDIRLNREAIILKKEADDSINDASKIAEDFQRKAAQISKDFKFDFFGDLGGKNKGEKAAERQAIKDLKFVYDTDLANLKDALTLKSISEKEYQDEIYNRTDKYVNDLIKLDKKRVNEGAKILAEAALKYDEFEEKQFAKLKSGERGNFTVDQTAFTKGQSYGKSAIGDAVEPGFKASAKSIASSFDVRIQGEKDAFSILTAGHKASLKQEQEHLQRIQKLNEDAAKAIGIKDVELAKKYSEAAGQAKVSATRLSIEQRVELEKMAIEFIGQAASAAVEIDRNKFNSASDARITKLESEKQREIDLNGNSASAKAAIDKRYNELIRKEKVKQAKHDKSLALTKIAIDTAVAVALAFAEYVWPYALVPAGFALAAGAVQAAVVASAPIPQFKKGKEKDGYKGPAIWGEAGFEVMEKKGKFYKADKPTYTHLQGDEKIYSHDASKKLVEDSFKYQEANDILATGRLQGRLAGQIRKGRDSQDIEKMAIAMRSGGISESAMERIMVKAIKNIPVQENHYDERGYIKRIREINERRTYLNGR